MQSLDLAKIGERIQKARKAKKYTQSELSEKCGCSSKHLSAVENGSNRASLELLMTLSIELDVPVDYFLKGSDYVAPSYLRSEIGTKISKCDSVQLKAVEQVLDSILELRDYYYKHGFSEESKK